VLDQTPGHAEAADALASLSGPGLKHIQGPLTTKTVAPLLLSAATETWRWDDFPCQEGGATCLRLHHDFSPVSIGCAEARQTRRLITLISVGWRPPDWHSSGACLALGTRGPFGLFTLPRVTPYRGGASADREWTPQATPQRYWGQPPHRKFMSRWFTRLFKGIVE
jgi:hypothetical protein